MKWQKLNNIFDLNNFHDGPYTHASNPTAVKIDCNTYRIFFSTRDENNKSDIGYFDYDLNQMCVIGEPVIPYIRHGKAGEIDESGLGIGCINLENQNLKFYCMGWQTPKNSHWRGDIVKVGIGENGILEKEQVLEVDDIFDKQSFSYPYLIKKATESIYYMFYGSTHYWETDNQEMLHTINYAISKDLINWEKKGNAINYILGKAQAFSRPTIIFKNDIYHMWFSYRGNGEKYRIGYANSVDLDHWSVHFDERNSIIKSVEGWDSEMVCYPNVFEYKDKLYMVYNGNGYGKTGIGLAVMEED